MEDTIVELFSKEELQEISNNFSDELKRSSQKEKTSLPFILNTLPHHPLVEDGEQFQVMSKGGSVFEKAIVSFHNKTLTVHSYEKLPLPTLHSKDVLCSFFLEHVDLTVKTVAINFAYPLNPILRGTVLDGILISGTKEHTFEGVVNEAVGQMLEEEVQSKQNRKINVTVANDTVCLILSGKRATPPATVGGIVGTGLNFGFFIDDHTVVNLESANFSRFTMTATGRDVDAHSQVPGKGIFEKEVSGGYLYKHYNSLMRQLNEKEIESTAQLTDIAWHGDARHGMIAQQLFLRSASLAACQIAGIIMYLNLENPVFVMEGSLFWDGYNYKAQVEEHLRLLEVPVPEFIQIKNSTIQGACGLVGII